jgi:hypothetical protein
MVALSATKFKLPIACRARMFYLYCQRGGGHARRSNLAAGSASPMTSLLAPLDGPGAALVAVLALALLWPPLVPFEPLWEVAAALGWAAIVATILAFRIVPAARLRGGRTAWRFSWHRITGDLALLLVALHVGVMVAGDPFVLDYLGWMMPIHVLAGVLAALAFLLAVLSREPALPAWLRLGGSRHLHVWAGIAAGGLTGWHVLAASSKLLAPWRYGLLAALFLALLAPAARGLVAGPTRRPPAPARSAPRGSAGTAGLLRLVALLGVFALLLGAVPHLALWLRQG